MEIATEPNISDSQVFYYWHRFITASEFHVFISEVGEEYLERESPRIVYLFSEVQKLISQENRFSCEQILR